MGGELDLHDSPTAIPGVERTPRIPRYRQAKNVSRVTPANGQVEAWDSTSKVWKPTDVTGVGGVGAAPDSEQYLVLAASTPLTAERVFTPGTGLSAVDGGAGGAYTLNGHLAVTLDADADTLLSLTTQTLGLDTQTANRVFAGPTTGGAAVPTFRALVAADIPSAIGAHALLDGSVNSDTTVSSVTRGDLIIGNSTPAWDDLAIGSANSVLWTDGTDPSWATHPRLGFVADTGGTDRLTLGTSTPHLTLTGNVQVSSGYVGINVAPITGDYINIRNTTTPDGTAGLAIGLGFAATAIGAGVILGVNGAALAVQSATNTTYALQFIYGTTGAYGANTLQASYGVYIQVQNAATAGAVITEAVGLNVSSPSFAGAALARIGTYEGIYVRNSASMKQNIGYGLRIDQLGNNNTGAAYSPAQTVQGGGINSSSTSLTVSGTSVATNDVILVESEFMLVTAGGGTTGLTVTRGYQNTTGAAHAAGVAVTKYTQSIPIHAAGPARRTDFDGSVHRMNFQFGSLNRQFGGGDGVIGIAKATTTPSTIPTGGGILYVASDGSLHYVGTSTDKVIGVP